MIQIHQVLAGADNFIYFLVCDLTQDTAVIDPTLAAPVFDFLKNKNLKLILNTHHHHDHVGGNIELKTHSACDIYCSEHDLDRIPGSTHGLKDGQTFVFAGEPIEILTVPGHTLGAIAFHLPQKKAVFTGDTLFTLGCGRIFEGTAAALYSSLQKLKKLPPDTLVYCGHEYGLQNSAFAQSLTPNNKVLAEYTQSLLQTQKWTSPSILANELKWNPFLTAENLTEFTRIRKMKDDFKLELHPRLRY